MATSLYPFTTTWTGAGDGTNWSDPANWSNGVPLPSAPASDGSQDIATIDNSVDTAPFGLVIAGDQSAGEIDLNVTDPASGPAVSLTGTLDMSTNVQPTGSGFGHINLTSGTFEIDGGTLEGAEVTEKGGTLTFGGASPITLGGDIIDGNVAIDNGVTVVMAASNGTVFDGVGGYGTATDVTISGGATLSTVGSIYLSGEIDIQAGGTLSLDGGPLYGWGSSGTFFADGGTVNVTNSFSVNADYIFEGEVNFTGAETISVAQGGELTFGVAPATPTAPTVIDLNGSTIDVTGALNLVNTVLENGTVILEAGSTYTADGTSSATLTDNRPAGQTNWTGAAGDGNWSNANNWTNGVPQSGLGFTTDGQSVAVINNVIETVPSTIVIGDVNAQDIYLNTADPAGGPSVSLTGTLDTSYGGEGGAYGYLDLTSGTFEIDGGSLNYTGVGLNGGTLAFGSAANGAEFLNTDILNGDFTINGSEVLLDGYNVFHGQGGGGPSTTTLTGGAQLIEASGTLAIDGTLDIQDGGDSTLFALDGGNLSGYGDEGATIFIDGGTFAIDASTTFSNTVNIYGGYMVIGETDAVPVITIDSSSVTSIGQTGGAQTIVNLDGGTLDVFGTLNLTNTYIENGTITVEAGATFNQDSTDTLEGVTVQGGLQTATNWTGGGDGTSWSDANNWDNGVPVAGGPYDTLGQNVTTIDNTHGDSGPFTVVLTGDQAGALVIVDATDPTDGVAVRIEGSLNLGFDESGGSITLGVLDANGGTVEIDGGTLDVLNINQLGGQVTFGSFAQWGAATLNASGIAGDLTIGNASELIIAANSFGAFNNAAQGTANTVTITDNSTLDIQGSLYSTNTIDIVSGSVILDGGSLGMGAGTKLVAEGGGLSINGSGTLNTLEYDGAVGIGQNNTLTIASGQTTLISNPGGQYAIALDGGNLQVLGTLDVDGIITGTGTLALGAGATLMDATVNAPARFDDPSIQINGNATLDNVTIDAPIDFASGAVLTIAGTETFGNAADSTPMTVDLNGGVLDVTGALNLTNTDISNGTVIVEAGGSLTTDAASALTNVTVEQTLADGDRQIIGQNVAITALQAITTANNVFVETGVDGGGTPTGTAGQVTFNDPTDSNNPVGFTGAGTVTVTDGNGLSNTDFNGATLDANVSGQTLAVITDTYSANYGSFTASNGGALVIGDAAHESANLVGGVLNAALSATGGSSVLLYGANGISVVNGQITLDGSSSIGVATASGTVALAQSLTSIGSQNPTTYLDQLGILNLNNGASFIDPNAVTLYGEINLTGGTLSTGGLTGNLVVFNNGFGGDLASGVTGYGTIDGAFGSTSGDIYMDASGGTLTYTGALAGFDNLEADTNSELIVNSAINADGNANGYDVTLQSGSTVDLTGQLVNTSGLYVNFSGSNATLILNDPAGVTLNSINVANAVTGDVIDLAGLVAATGSGGTPDVTITRTSPGVVTVTIDPLGNPGAADTFTITNAANTKVTFNPSDGNGGSEIVLTADPVITTPGGVEITQGFTTPLTGVSVTDLGASGATVTATLSDATGLLSATGTGVSGSGTTTLTVSGSLTQVNAALATLTDTNQTISTDAITVSAVDSAGDSAVTQALNTFVIAPIVIATPTQQYVTQNTSTALDYAEVYEQGALSGADLTVTLADGSGLLSATGTGVSGSGTTTLTITGSQALVNADLATVTVKEPSQGSDTITASAQDAAGDKAQSTSTTITTYPPPTTSAPATAAVTQNSITPLSGISVSDPAAPAGNFSVTLSDTSDLLSTTGNGLGTTSITFVGSLAQVNADLAALTIDAPNAGTDTVNVTATDAAGGTSSQNIAVTATHVPAPDLTVSAITAPSAAIEGQTVQLTWTVTNSGDATATGPWTDNVYAASDQAGDNKVLVGSFTYTGTLTPGQSETQTQTVDLNTNFPLGAQTGAAPTYFIVQTDAGNQTGALSGIQNHIGVSAAPTGATATVNWAQIFTELAAPGMDATDLNLIEQRFVSEVGTTYASFAAATANAMTALNATSSTPVSENDAIALLFRQAVGGIIDPVLAQVTAPSSASTLLDGLLTPTYGTDLGIRNSGGAFGDGWASEFNDVGALGPMNGFGANNPNIGGQSYVIETIITYVDQYGDFLGQSISYQVVAPAGYDVKLLDPSNPNSNYTQTNANGTIETFSGTSGLVVGISDGQGNAIAINRNAAGLITSITTASGHPPVFTVNAEGNITSATDSAGHTITYAYDASGTHLLGTTTAAGTTSYQYSASADAFVTNALTGIINPDGTSQTYTYTAQGDIASQSNNGAAATTFAYSGANTITQTSGDGLVTTYTYDQNGQITSIADATDGTFDIQRDANGNITSLTTATGQTYQFTYDANGNLTGSTDPLGHSVATTFAPGTSSITSVTDQNGNTTQYQYNASGQLSGTTPASGAGTQYQYNAAGQVSELTEATGATIQLSYDAAGQVTLEKFSDGTSQAYSYNTDGTLALSTAADGSVTTYAYTAQGLLKSVTNAAGQVESYSYNAAGQETQRVEPDGSTTNYAYTSAGQLSQITDGSGAVIATYTYDAAGLLTQKVTGNGGATYYSHDTDGNVSEIRTTASGGATTSDLAYTYDADGRIATATSGDGKWTYTYDAANQLTHAVFASTNSAIPNQNLSYQYDAAGNRTQTIFNGATTNYTTNALNQYTAADGTTYSYDANGNLITKAGGGVTTTYTYNVQNQILSSTDGTTTTAYTYDALGNIASETVNGVKSTYVTDPLAISSGADGPLSAVAQAYNASGQATATYTYGNGLTAVTSNGTTNYYNADASGNITSLSGANGVLTQTYAYSPTGTVLDATGSVVNPFQFNGETGAMTQANGLVSTGARYYDPTTGRFTTQDPSGQTGGIDLYTYAGNNPVNYVDATGDSISLAGLAAGVTGVIAGVGALLLLPEAAAAGTIYFLGTGIALAGGSIYQAVTADGGKNPLSLHKDTRSDYVQAFVSLGATVTGTAELKGAAFYIVNSAGTLNSVASLFPGYGNTFDKVFNETDTVNVPVADGDGDVHLTTFDGLHYNFQAVGEFVLTRSTTASDNFQVQIRLSALGGTESSPTYTTQIGVQVGNDTVTFGTGRSATVWVDGVASNLSASANTLTLAAGTISELSQNTYQITEKTGEIVDVTDNGSYFDYSIDLAPSAKPGSVEGLLGSYTGTANAFELPDGTALGSNISATDLYQTFGNAWRITDATSLLNYAAGENTATYTDLVHPDYDLPVTSLPTAVVQAATAAVAAAGLTGTAATDAIYDYLATGDPSVITNAAADGSAAPVTVTAVITPSAPPPPSMGISPAVPTVTEVSGQTPVTFTVSLTSAATADTVVNYAVSPAAIDGGKTYFDAADFGGTLPSGSVTILAGQTQATITVEVPDSALGTSPDKWLAVGITTPGADPIYATSAQVDIINDTPVAGVAAQPVLEYVPGNAAGTTEIAPNLTQSGNSYVLNLGNVVQGTSVASLQFALANLASAPADGLSAQMLGAAGSGFNTIGLASSMLINAGNAATAATVQPLTTNLGALSTVITFGATDVNSTGYAGALPNITLTVTENVIAAAKATLGTTAINLPDVRVGSTDTQTITVTNSAQAGGAPLDVTAGAAAGAVATGSISQLAAGASDSSSLAVGIATTTAGLQSSFVTLDLASDLGNGVAAPLALNQSVSVTGSVYRAAAASTTQAAAIVHVGDTGSQDLAILNSDPADGYSEGLRATVTGTTGGISAAGTTGLIAAGATDASSVVVSYSTASAGVVSGQVNLGLTSDGTGVDSLAPISLGTDPVAFSVQVDNYATADLKETAGGGTLTGSAATGYDLDLGTLSEGSGAATIDLAALNSASGLADLLAGTFGITGDTAAFTNSGFGAFGGLGAGQSGGASSVSLSTANDGTFSETITLTGTGSNASGYSGTVAPVTLTIHGEVAESPGTVTHSTTPGTFFGAAFASSTFSYTAAGRLYLQTFYDASGAVVASESRDANGGYAITVGGVRVQAVTVNADGSSDAYYTGHGSLLGQAYVASDNLHYASGALELQTFYDASGATVATESYSASGGYTITIGGAVVQAKTVNSDGSYDYRTNTAGTVLGTAYAGYDNAYTAAGFRDLETYYNASGTIIAQTTYATNGGYSFSVGGVRVLALTVNTDGSYDAYYSTSGTFLGQAYAASDNLHFASGALEQQTYYNASGAVVATESYTTNGGYTATIGGSVVQTRTVNSDGSYDIRYVTSGTILGTAYASYDFAYTASGFRDAETFYDGSGTVVGSATFATNGSYTATFGGVRVLALTVNSDGSYDFYYGTKGTLLGQAYASSDNLHAASGALESQTFYDASGAVVASETYQANGGHTVTIEGAVVQVQTGYADGSFLIENENVQGQDFTQAYIAFYHPGTAIAVSATLDDGGNRSNLTGVGLTWTDTAGVAQVVDGADTFQLGADTNSALDITGAANATLAFGKGDGAQVITGFATSGGGADALSFSQSVFADYAHLMGATQQQGSDLLITLDANDTLLLKNVSMSSFTSANAHFT